MAPVVQLARLVWTGPLFTDESWSCSLHFHNAGAAVPMPAAAYADAIEAWMVRAGSRISAAADLAEVKFNNIDPVTGKYSLPVSNNHVVDPVVSGVAAVGPGQLSLAVTTATALARGRGHAGRFYPPTGLPAALNGSDGTISAVIAEEVGDSAAQLINELNAVDPAYRAVVFSKVGQSVEVITHLRVGRIYDTMRSRRTSLQELHVSNSPITP